MSNFKKLRDKLLKESVETSLTFVEALYSGKQFIRCKYTRPGMKYSYATFDVREDTIYEITTLDESELMSTDWEASDNIEFLNPESFE